MATKSRYLGYAGRVQHIRDKKKKKTSTKESVLSKLKELRGKEFTMTIPVAEGNQDEY